MNGAFYTPLCLGDRYTMNIGCVVRRVEINQFIQLAAPMSL